ncbi:BsaWI family type II restriction enzyme [Hippea alviniae]|uniref:BsaWI family type II restriction enzyme n=1 Tax=Hippea alviniae TaxID=1279027 RepID=UPI0003B663CC|nr:BsaWI family type II restriction enzyme [Hippea alviniae]
MEIDGISEILESEKKSYLNKKIDEYIKKGFSSEESVNRANQSWRTYIGFRVQKIIFELLKREIDDSFVGIISDKELLKSHLEEEYQKVKRKLAIDYGQYLFLPDADIILYKRCKKVNDIEIIAVVSVKNSFRERGFETAYWKLKLTQSSITSRIVMFLATPDKDGEISYRVHKRNPRKMRIILEHELDGIYFLKSDFEKTEKAKHFSEMIRDLKRLIKTVDC